MFELFNHDARIPFVRYGRFTVAVSIVLMLVSIVLLFRPGFELGLDFTGGSMIELRMDQPVELATVREALAMIIPSGRRSASVSMTASEESSRGSVLTMSRE